MTWTNERSARLGFGPWLEQVTVWSPDGKQVIYTANENFSLALYRKNADGPAQRKALWTLALRNRAPGTGRDGKYLLVRKERVVVLDGAGQAAASTAAIAMADPQRAILSGRKIRCLFLERDWSWEVYVSLLPGIRQQDGRCRAAEEKNPAGGAMGRSCSISRRQVDGRRCAEDRTGFESVARRPISNHPGSRSLPWISLLYDVTPDGQEFLVNTKSIPPTRALSVILNWSADMEK